MINILKSAYIYNIGVDVGITQYQASRAELLSMFDGSPILSISSLNSFSFEADLGCNFYCKDGQIITTNTNSLCNMTCQMLSHPTASWSDITVTNSSGVFSINFNQVLPDLAQLVHKIRFTYINLSPDPSIFNSVELWTVDYPMQFSYTDFAVAASTYSNSPINVFNNSIDGLAKNIKIIPPYSGNYMFDQSLVLTVSGKIDSDKFHIDNGISMPEQAPWSAGYFNNTTISGNYITLSGTAVSGTYTSPVLRVTDPNYVALYIYEEDTNSHALIEKEWTSINSVIETRASNETPLPNFLINIWTKRLYSMRDLYGVVSVASIPTYTRRIASITTETAPGPEDSYWVIDMTEAGCVQGRQGGSIPYINGKSERIYMKGDGTILAQNPPDLWQVCNRDIKNGYPFKIYGDINDSWVAATAIGCLGGPMGACELITAPEGYHMRLTQASLIDNSNWNSGQYIRGMESLYPFKSHGWMGSPGNSADPVLYDYIGMTTLAKPGHPNEWMVIVAELFPLDEGATKFMSLYLLNVRNSWTSKKLFLGSYTVGDSPADEGYAICSCSNADEYEGGFWLHVGYSTNIIQKWGGDGNLIIEYSITRGYNSIKESNETGCLWAVRNDGVFYYRENITAGTLTAEFKIEDSRWNYLQMGGTDAAGNLWVIDRDDNTIYRINLSTQSIDYTCQISYAIAVWPHPTENSAYVLISFNEDTFSPAVKRILMDDPYQYEEFICAVPSTPFSDITGVQFLGKISDAYISPGPNDFIWGTNDLVTTNWEPYVNSSPTLPAGNYKQFRLTFRRDDANIDSPLVQKIRIPAPLILNQVPYKKGSDVYVNPHLRYDKQTGHFFSQLLGWW